MKSESFLELPWSLVLALARDGELQVDEADLFKAVQAWVARSPTERRRHVDEARIRRALFFVYVCTHRLCCVSKILLLLLNCCSVWSGFAVPHAQADELPCRPYDTSTAKDSYIKKVAPQRRGKCWVNSVTGLTVVLPFILANKVTCRHAPLPLSPSIHNARTHFS